MDQTPTVEDAARLRLIEWRDQGHYTQRELAKAVGMTEGNISAVLKGKRLLSIHIVACAAQLAGRSAAEAFTLPSDEMRPVTTLEAEVLRYLRKLPRSVIENVLGWLRYSADETPAVGSMRRTIEHMRYLSETDRRRIEAFVTMVREGAIGPDVLVGLEQELIGGASERAGGRRR